MFTKKFIIQHTVIDDTKNTYHSGLKDIYPVEIQHIHLKRKLINNQNKMVI